MFPSKWSSRTLGVGGVQSSCTDVSGGETVGLEKHLKRKLYVWARKEKHRTTRRVTLQNTIVTMKYHWVCCFCWTENWRMWRSVSTSSVLGRVFMWVMTSSKRITSDGFISSSACISKSASTGILSGVYRRGVLKDDRVFPSSCGIVRRVFVDIEQPVVSTIIPVPTSVLL